MLENDVILTAIYGIIRAVPMNLSHLTSVHNMFQLLYGNNNMYCRKNNLRAHRVGFAAFSCAIRNWWKKPCISYVVKCIIRWESDGRKVPICWKKMRTNFPGSPNSMDFVGFSLETIFKAFPNWWIFLPFPMLREIGEKTHAFPIWWSIPQDGNLIEKTTHFMEKVWKPTSYAFPIRWVLLPFLMLLEIL